MREIRDHARHTAVRHGSMPGVPRMPDLATSDGDPAYQGPPLAAPMNIGRKMPRVIKLGEVTW